MAKDMNPPEGGPSPGQTARAGSWRAFRPLIIWLVLAMPILGWDIHRRNAARTFLRADVKLEGGALEAPLQIEVSGKPFSLREPVPVGNQVIKIWSQDTEVWETNKFIWYGENPLGTVQLKRSRGELRVAVKPAPVQVSITGRLTNATSQTASPVFQGLPVGNYRVRLRFQHFTREVTATVTRNTTSTLDESFPAGNLQIGSEPPGARYELRNVRGDAPALISKDGTFYAPKIDIYIDDALGREWQMATIQADLMMVPERFDLHYIDENGEPQRPICIHRAILGSLERFIGILVEHFAGAFPLWVAPVQAVIIPIADRHVDAAGELAAVMRSRGLRVEVDGSDNRMQNKIRLAQGQKIPYMVVLGDREIEARTASPRTRAGEQQPAENWDAFADRLAEESRARTLG